MTGTVFDIKEFSVHDGPGPRVTVFLKGCPLRCKWCHNPEGLSPQPQLLHKKTLCTDCGLCRVSCGHEECQESGRCWKKCPNGALSVSGVLWEAEDLARKLRGYGSMLASMGGGVTLSGGEPLMQAAFAAEVLSMLLGMHRAIQTSGYASEAEFRAVLAHTDYVMMDLKLADPAAHKACTGVDNAPILRNFRVLQDSGKPYLIRVPLIPGLTDTKENLCAISQIVKDSPVELLEYNRFAPAKYDLVGRAYPLSELPPPNEIDLSVFLNATLSKL